MKKMTIAVRIDSYYKKLMDVIWNHFHPGNQDPGLFLARFLRSKDEPFAAEILNGIRNYNHSMAFSTRLDFTREGKRKHRALQMKYFRVALDLCWLAGIKIPRPPWRVLRAFPDLRLLTTKKGRFAYALGKRMSGNKPKPESNCGCEGSCPVCRLGEVDNHKCNACHAEFCPKCHGITNGILSINVSPCSCKKPQKKKHRIHAIRSLESDIDSRRLTTCGINIDAFWTSTYLPRVTCQRCMRSLTKNIEKRRK